MKYVLYDGGNVTSRFPRNGNISHELGPPPARKVKKPQSTQDFRQGALKTQQPTLSWVKAITF